MPNDPGNRVNGGKDGPPRDGAAFRAVVARGNRPDQSSGRWTWWGRELAFEHRWFGGVWTTELEEASMAIKVVVEFQARPGARAELASMLESISATFGPSLPGFLGSIVYEVLDSPDALVEIAEWDSADAQAAAVEHAMASGVYVPVIELVAVPFKATRIGQLNERQ